MGEWDVVLYIFQVSEHAYVIKKTVKQLPFDLGGHIGKWRRTKNT